MDNRIGLGLGTAAIALLLLPLGYQLYSSTSLTPIGVPPVAHQAPPVPQPRPEAQVEVKPKDGPAQSTTTQTASTPLATTEELPVDALKKEGEVGTSNKVRTVTVRPDGSLDQPATLAPAKPDEQLAAGRDEDDVQLAAQVASTAEPAPPPTGLAAGTVAPKQVASQPLAMPNAAPMMDQNNLGGAYAGQRAAGEMAVDASAPVPTVAAMPDAFSQQQAPQHSVTDPSGDQFTKFTESPLKVVAEEPVSTFSIDVDTASYSYVRSALQDGWMPEPDAVRIEEMINYFSYNYPGPDSAETPFKPTVAIYPSPWNPKTELMQIAIKGYTPPATHDEASNLVFLIDTSGSMDEPDKLPLLKRAFALLVDQLTANDTVSIVVYAGSAGVVLEPTKATEKSKILGALDNLSAGGSTAGAEGIELAYRMAERAKIQDGNNRIILATDGDFNVGIEDPDALKDYIKQKRDSGVFLSVLGFGQGNLGDDTMQALAQNGNGNASYIDSFREAQKVLVAEGGGTLETIAKDVKIQVEFNPAFVSEYRLVGYETRALNREDFNNDKVDAGDIGAGTTVTAIYEITPTGSGAGLVDPLRYGNGGATTETTVAAPLGSDELGFLKLRYKLPNEDTSKLIEFPITRSLSVDNIANAGEDQRWAAAVAAFAQKLKGSNYGDMSWDAIRTLAQSARGSDEAGYRAEFMQMIDAAKVLDPNG